MSEILPTNRQLEEIVKDNLELSDNIAEFYVEQSGFTDSTFELLNPSLTEYLKAMGQLLSSDGASSQESYYVMQESFNFARRASEMMRPAGVRILVGDYVKRLNQSGAETEEQLLKQVLDEADEYLKNRPYLSGLIYGAMSDIDPSGNHTVAAETMAAITFMQIENGERESYIDEVTNEFAAEVEYFSQYGNLDDLTEEN